MQTNTPLPPQTNQGPSAETLAALANKTSLPSTFELMERVNALLTANSELAARCQDTTRQLTAAMKAVEVLARDKGTPDLLDAMSELRKAVTKAAEPAPEPPANGLSPAEVERLVLLIEESGEVIQAATKVLRHGWESYHPDRPEVTNRDELEKELGQATLAKGLLIGADDVSSKDIGSATAAKRKVLACYLHHQPEYVLVAAGIEPCASR